MKYNPCSKEFQEKAKELGLTGHQYIQKLTEDGKLRDPIDIDRETNDAISKRLGYGNTSQYKKEWRRKNEMIKDTYYVDTYMGKRIIIYPEMYGSIEKDDKYNPCSKEFQEKAKELGLTGHQYIQKLTEEGKLRNPTDIDRETNNAIFERLGYNKSSDYIRKWRHDNGIQAPMEENKDCAHYLGTCIAERKYGRIILPEIFGSIVQEMPYGHPKYDFLVTNNVKIDVKSCCIRENQGWYGFEPHVRFNDVTDYFVILAFDDRENLNLLHVWSIGRNEIIRGHKFYMRDSIKITNKYGKLLEFKRYEWTSKLECLKK